MTTMPFLSVLRPSFQIVTVLLLLLLYSLGGSSYSLRSIVSNPLQLLSRPNDSLNPSEILVEHARCPPDNINSPHIIFPGGGIFFYWQAGVVSYLREKNYDLTSNATLCGASAGALTATLTSCHVDFYRATELALHLAHQANVWNRPLGLQGVWGPMIFDWLNELLPNEDELLCLNNRRLSLLITPFPSLRKVRVAKFQNRNDLIECNMASIHLVRKKGDFP